jgi:hypothetical protein
MESPDAIKKAGVRRAPNGRAIQLHPAMAARKWEPGQSGNPSGKGGLYHEAVRIARENAPAAMQKLAALMDCGDPRVEAVAANALLERAFGKPKDYDPKSEVQSVQAFDPSAMSAQELAAIKSAVQLILRGTRTIEVIDD